jgi:hypothetical protein
VSKQTGNALVHLNSTDGQTTTARTDHNGAQLTAALAAAWLRMSWRDVSARGRGGGGSARIAPAANSVVALLAPAAYALLPLALVADSVLWGAAGEAM